MRRAVGLAACASVSIAIVCCSAYESDDASPGSDAASDAPSLPDAPLAEDVDAGPPKAIRAPQCPRPPGPSCAPAACEQRLLYAPPSAGVEFPWDIATDSAFVYWTALSAAAGGDSPYNGTGDARIRRVARTAGSVPAVIAEGQRAATSLTIAGDWLYWLASSGAIWELRRARLDCPERCTIETLAQLGAGPFSSLVEIDADTLLATKGNGTTLAIAIAAMSVVTVSTATTTSNFPSLAATSTEGFATGGLTTTISRIPAATRTAVPLATLPASDAAIPGLVPITTDCSSVFGWRGQEQWKVPIEGGSPSSMITSVPPSIYALTTDRSFIYLAAPNVGGVFAVSLADGTSTPVRTGNMFRVAVDDVGVYWGDHDQTSGGALWMMVK